MQFPLLKELGLNDYEVEIYELLLRKGRSIVRDLLNETSIKRANLYHILQSLQEKWLILATEGKQTAFEAQDPSNIWNVYNKQEAALKITKQSLGAILPGIIDIYKSQSTLPSVQAFLGLEGAETAIQETLRAKSAQIK